MSTGRASVRWLLAVLNRRKWPALAVFIACTAAIASFVASLPNIYVSTAVVLVEGQQVPEAFVKSTVTSELETRLSAISQEILSRARLEALIARFNLYEDLRREASPEVVFERMRRDITVELKGGESQWRGRGATVAFNIGYQGADPRLVADVSNALATAYIDENLRMRDRQASGTTEFLKAQLEDTKQRLDEQERQVGDFKKQHLGELPQHTDANRGILEGLAAQLRLNSENQARAFSRREALTAQAPPREAPPVPAPAPVVRPEPVLERAPTAPDPATTRLVRLQQDLAELRTRYSDKYPDVLRLNKEIAELERQIAETRRASAREASLKAPPPAPPPLPPPPAPSGPPPIGPEELRRREALVVVEAETAALKVEETRLRSAIAIYQGRLERAPRIEQEFQKLSRDYDSTRELYTTLLKRYDEARLAGSLERGRKGEQFRVVETAVPPERPAAPKRTQLMLIGVVLALAAASVVVFVPEYLDDGFHTVDDLRAFTTVPVVRIPKIIPVSGARPERRRAWLTALGATAAIVLLVWLSHLAAYDNERIVALLARSRF